MKFYEKFGIFYLETIFVCEYSYIFCNEDKMKIRLLSFNR